jgi:hypothetical protein
MYVFLILNLNLSFNSPSHSLIGAPQIEKDSNMLDISNSKTNDDISGIFIYLFEFEIGF